MTRGPGGNVRYHVIDLISRNLEIHFITGPLNFPLSFICLVVADFVS